MQDMGKLYNDYFQTVFRYLFCLTNDSDISEELTQETFYQAMKTYDSFRGDCKVSVWLCQIAKLLWYKEYRRRNKYAFHSINDMQDSLLASENVEQIVLEKDSKVTLHKKIQTLDGKTKEVIYLRITGELSFREIGELLGKNETWARVTFYRGKQKLMKEG